MSIIGKVLSIVYVDQIYLYCNSDIEFKNMVILVVAMINGSGYHEVLSSR